MSDTINENHILSLDKLSKVYGKKVVLKNLSTVFLPSTICILAGKNGAGKTTLLRMLAGLARPSAGKIRYEGEIKPGYLGHETFVYPGLTALENLAFWSRASGLKPDCGVLENALERVGLIKFRHEPAGTFSRGMAQRLNLARVLSQQPALFLLDEPATGLDASSKQILISEMQAARKNGALIIWVSHDLDTNMQFADRVLYLDKARLVYDASAATFPQFASGKRLEC